MKKRIITLAEHYGVSVQKFKELGVLNPNLNTNTLMFIDPVCLQSSSFELFSINAKEEYEKYFEDLYESFKAYVKLSGALKQEAKATLIKKLRSKEIQNTCLGYSVSGTTGSGVGPELASKMLEKAGKIFAQGADDKAIFRLVHLFTSGIGPDYISDMATNIILPQIMQFTEAMAPKLGLPVEEQRFLRNKGMYPKHPHMKGPVLLLPDDILNPLPIDVDIEDVFNGYNPSDEIKFSVGTYIGDIFQKYSQKSERRERLSEYIGKSKDVLKDFLSYIRGKKSKPYDFADDPKGFYFQSVLRELFEFDKIKPIEKPPLEVIQETILRFKRLIDNNNDIKRTALWGKTKRKPEGNWQTAFHLYIYEIMNQNNIDITPESETGRGPVDFKLSQGSDTRILIEMKLSDNNPVKGLKTQLERYKECTESVVKAYFICFDVEKDLQKSQRIQNNLFKKKKELDLDTEIIWINGRIESSASK